MRRSREDIGFSRNGCREVCIIVVGGLQAKRPESEVFERFQNFRPPLQEDFLVSAVEIGEHFRVSCRTCCFRGNSTSAHLQFEPGSAHQALQKLAQGLGGGLPVQFPIANQFLGHRALE